MYGHHDRSVLRVDVEQGGGSHQILRQVAQQRHCPGIKHHIYTVSWNKVYLYTITLNLENFSKWKPIGKRLLPKMLIYHCFYTMMYKTLKESL